MDLEVDIIDVLKKIRQGELYCRICLRTEKETRLVPPKKLLIYTQLIHQDLFKTSQLTKGKLTACYMCEAAASRAMRIHKACIKANYLREFLRTLTIKAPPYEKQLEASIQSWNTNVSEYRKRMTMRPTEVLIVDSTGMQVSPLECSIPVPSDDQNEPGATSPHISASEKITGPLGKEDGASNLPSWAPDFETVVLEDEEDPLAEPTNPTPPVPKVITFSDILNCKAKETVAALIPNQMQLLVKEPTERSNFVLHPLVQGKKDQWLIPTMSCKYENGELTHLENIQEHTLPQVVINRGIVSLQPASGLQAVPVKTKQLVSTDSKTMDTYNGVFLIEKNIQENSDIDALLKNALEIEIQKTRKRKSEDDRGGKKRSMNFEMVSHVPDAYAAASGSQPIAVISNVTSSAEPLPKNDRIDWEDKIPMDVISFMDATDPSAPSLNLATPSHEIKMPNHGAPLPNHRVTRANQKVTIPETHEISTDTIEEDSSDMLIVPDLLKERKSKRRKTRPKPVQVVGSFIDLS